MSGSNSRSIFVLHLWRSTPSPPQVPSMFHIRLCWGQFQTQHNICFVPFEHPLHLQLQSHICFTLDYVWGQHQIQLQMQMQIHICVVPFKGPVHLHLQSHLCLTLDPEPAPAPNLCCTFWGSTPSPAPVPSIFHLRSCGAIVLSTNNPMLSSKFNISSHIPVYLNIICPMFT